MGQPLVHMNPVYAAVVYLPSISCPTLRWELWNVVTCQDWTSKRITKCQAALHLDKVHVLNNLWISQGPTGGGSLVCVYYWMTTLTCRGRGVRAEPSTRPVGQGSSTAAPGFDWMNPRSHPRNRWRGGATCFRNKNNRDIRHGGGDV